MSGTNRRIAWLKEDGDDPVIEGYRLVLSDYKPDFFSTPAELLEHLNDGYALFVLPMIARPEPYSRDETHGGYAVGLRVAIDIRKNPLTKDTPILISSATALLYVDELKKSNLPCLNKPYTGQELRTTIGALLQQPRKP